ncbi:MAG: VanZ family protein [Candidatus Saccharibacteria bacterium]|nr:VanZ family protein [Microbacteriaceae bacterium]
MIVTSTAPPRSRARLWIGFVSLAVCLTTVLLVTMWPVPVDTGYGASISKLLGVLHRNGIPEWIGYNKLEFFANIVMFIPLGFLTALLLPARIWWLALVICPAFSICIELTQLAFLPARFATLSDVLSNSLGAVLGVTVAVSLRLVVDVRDQKVIARALWGLQQSR